MIRTGILLFFYAGLAMLAAQPAAAQSAGTAGRSAQRSAATDLRIDYSKRALWDAGFTQAQLQLQSATIRQQATSIKRRDREIDDLQRERQGLRRSSTRYRELTRQLQATIDAQEETISSILAQLAANDRETELRQRAFANSFRTMITDSPQLLAAMESYRLGKPGARQAMDAAADAEHVAEQAVDALRQRTRNGFRRRQIAYQVLTRANQGQEPVEAAIAAFQQAISLGDDLTIDSFDELARLQLRVGRFREASTLLDKIRLIDAAETMRQPLRVANLELMLAKWTRPSEDIENLIENAGKLISPLTQPGLVTSVSIIEVAPSQNVPTVTFSPIDQSPESHLVAAGQFISGQDRRQFAWQSVAARPQISDQVDARLMEDRLKQFALFEVTPAERCLLAQLLEVLRQGDAANFSEWGDDRCKTLLANKTTDPVLRYREEQMRILFGLLALAPNFGNRSPSFPASSIQGQALERQLGKLEKDALALKQIPSTSPFDDSAATSTMHRMLGTMWLQWADNTEDPNLYTEARRLFGIERRFWTEAIAAGASGTYPRGEAKANFKLALKAALASNDMAEANRLLQEGNALFGGENPLPGARLSDEKQRLDWLSELTYLSLYFRNAASGAAPFSRSYLDLAIRLKKLEPDNPILQQHEWLAYLRHSVATGDEASGKQVLALCDRYTASAVTNADWQERCKVRKSSPAAPTQTMGQ